MNGEMTEVLAFDTVSLNIPKADLSFLKTLVKKMGWEIKYLNDETMKAIEDNNDIAFSGTVDEFKEWAKNL